MNKLFWAVAVGSSLMLGGMTGALAHDRGHGWKQHHHRHHHHHRHDHSRGRVHIAPPVVYAPRYYAPAYGYAPPPVVYPAPVYVERPYYPRPGVTISVPPVFIGF